MCGSCLLNRNIGLIKNLEKKVTQQQLEIQQLHSKWPSIITIVWNLYLFCVVRRLLHNAQRTLPISIVSRVIVIMRVRRIQFLDIIRLIKGMNVNGRVPDECRFCYVVALRFVTQMTPHQTLAQTRITLPCQCISSRIDLFVGMVI